MTTTDTVKREILGVPVDALTMDDLLDRVHAAIMRRERLRIGVVNAAKLVNMRRDPVLLRDVLGSDVIVADGASVVWASRLLREPVPERVAGIDLMLGMLRRGDKHGYRVYCLGATPDVLRATVEAIRRDHPGVGIAGAHHGYFGESEEPGIAAAIAASSADILFVAMTSPKKEHFLARWGEGLGVPVCHGVGGSFDVLAGKVRRAPLAWQRLGLEWLYRVWQEPRRLWKRYLVTNSLFGAMVSVEIVRRRLRIPLRTDVHRGHA
jgi:N-acetylglucosaminyldiphosphoundecaprenol N-acetyl-beta-D-mannosaminyltransferase